MDINYVAVLIATVLQFGFGALWYTYLFGNAWMEIHAFKTYSDEEQAEMMKGMPWIYALQFFVTLVSTFVLALFAAGMPTWNIYGMAGFFWLGFVVTTQVSAVIFGGTPRKWMFKKTAIMAGAAFFGLHLGMQKLRHFIISS